MSSSARAPINRGDILEAIQTTLEFLSLPDNRQIVAIESFQTYVDNGRYHGSFADHDVDIALRIAMRHAFNLDIDDCDQDNLSVRIVDVAIILIQCYDFHRDPREPEVSHIQRKLEFVSRELIAQDELGAPEESYADGG